MEDLKNILAKTGTPVVLFSEYEFSNSYQQIQKALPRLKHHYALKPLPLAECVRIIENNSGYFDIASLGELEIVKNVNPHLINKCIYTHPIKKISEIEAAIREGVTIMAVDTINELKKFIPWKNQAKILIRLAFPNDEALFNLSEKFGADENYLEELLSFSKDNQLNVIGLSFHVGSQMKRPDEHIKSIIRCRDYFNLASNKFGYEFKVLDIGGGFPALYTNEDMDLDTFCAPIRVVLDDLFPDTELWSEPGRAISANSLLLVTQVIGKVNKNNRQWYYLDDGVYGTFAGMMYKDVNYDLIPLKHFFNDNSSDTYLNKLSILAGPTCDSIDIVARDIFMPELEMGDYLIAKRIGAYSHALRTQFNLLPEAKLVSYDFELSKFE